MAKLSFPHLSVFVALTLLIACSERPVDEEQKATQSTSLFGGLSQQQGYGEKVYKGYPIRFPHDHQSHPQYAIEWWYLTANLYAENGQMYPLQWTLFRFADHADFAPWANNQMYMAHGKISHQEQSWFAERFARGGVGNAGVIGASEDAKFTAFLDNWRWQSQTSDLFPANLQFQISPDVLANLQMTAEGPYILHDHEGYSVKVQSGEQASYYYSQPFIEISGELVLPNGVVSVQGNGWFDHEWSSQYLNPKTLGWDWFSIHLDNGSKLMLFNLRQSDTEDFWSGSFISNTGEKQHLNPEQIFPKMKKSTEVNGKKVPLHWQFDIPHLGLNLSVAPFKNDQWNKGRFEYYEGAILVSGTHRGKGFIELTGY